MGMYNQYVDGHVYSADGNYRVAVVGDNDPARPDHDGGYPILAITFSGYVEGYDTGAHANSFVAGATAALTYFARYHDRATALDMFDRWLRIFHDGQTLTALVDYYSVTMVAFSGRPLSEAWGIDHDPATAPTFGDYEAYWAGEVYYLVGAQRTVETSVVTTTFPDGEIVVTNTAERVVWAPVETLTEYYGLSDAKAGAVEDFAYLTGHDGPTLDYVTD